MKLSRTRILAVMALIIGILAILLHLLPGPPPGPQRVALQPPPRPTAKADRVVLRWKPGGSAEEETTLWAQLGQDHAVDRARTDETSGKPGAIPNEHVLSFFNAYDKHEFIKLAESRHIPVLGSSRLGHAVHIRVRDDEEYQNLLNSGPAPVDTDANYLVRTPKLVVGKNPLPEETGYIGFGEHALKWLGVSDDNSAWGKGVTVAVLDTGVLSHPALADAIIRQVSIGVPSTIEGGQADHSPHGTAVASIIAGKSDDITGMAPASTILSIPVLSPEGSGDSFNLANGIVEAVDQGANIINLCLGTQGDTFLLRQAVAYAQEKGVAIVAAVGNEAVEGVLYPARYDGVVAVSAVDAGGQHLFFANRGEQVDLSAPGFGINAAWSEGSVVPFSGTSAAAPFVSGALAALLSGESGLTASEAVSLLRQYGNDIGAPGKDTESGFGVMSIQRIQERDIDGIYDVAVGDVYLSPSDPSAEDLTVLISAQNRGTESMDQLDLQVTVEGKSSSLAFYNVAVGATVSEAFVIPKDRLEKGGEIQVQLDATIPAQEDRNPRNNTRNAVITISDSNPDP